MLTFQGGLLVLVVGQEKNQKKIPSIYCTMLFTNMIEL